MIDPAPDTRLAARPGASPGEGGVERSSLDKLSRKKTRRILNCLTESTFFYRNDDRDLFDYLRRHRAAYQRFFDGLFDWDLHVDRKVARLFKRATENPGLTPKQRHLFDLTRRDQAILFMLLLEFHELSLSAQNVHHEHDDDLCFLLSDFITHALTRHRQILGERAPGDRELLASVVGLFRELERHRFVTLLERGPEAGGEVQELWAFLPGMHCYEPSRLTCEIVRRSHGIDEVADSGEAPHVTTTAASGPAPAATPARTASTTDPAATEEAGAPPPAPAALYRGAASTPPAETTGRLLEPGARPEPSPSLTSVTEGEGGLTVAWQQTPGPHEDPKA